MWTQDKTTKIWTRSIDQEIIDKMPNKTVTFVNYSFSSYLFTTFKKLLFKLNEKADMLN